MIDPVLGRRPHDPTGGGGRMRGRGIPVEQELLTESIMVKNNVFASGKKQALWTLSLTFAIAIALSRASSH